GKTQNSQLARHSRGIPSQRATPERVAPGKQRQSQQFKILAPERKKGGAANAGGGALVEDFLFYGFLRSSYIPYYQVNP
ncbi:MAG: hypothetical protein K6U80_02425, partial [Firmicutes bacterium]|nr:hypothetical protein [Bacillota bacterium]